MPSSCLLQRLPQPEPRPRLPVRVASLRAWLVKAAQVVGVWQRGRARLGLDCHATLRQLHGRQPLTHVPFLLLESLTKPIGLPHELEDVRFMGQAVEQCCRHPLILECVIMPLSLIVLLVEAILGAVSHLLLLNIPSRACLWLAGIR